MILAAGEASDHLFIIESGVVSVELSRSGVKFETGRMGPGEVIGEGDFCSGCAIERRGLKVMGPGAIKPVIFNPAHWPPLLPNNWLFVAGQCAINVVPHPL